jgi:long-chain acyl-CoA synthetase
MKKAGCTLETLPRWMTTTGSRSLIVSRWVWLELLYLRIYLTRLSQNIMKLSQGEYVALEKLENSYSACPIVQQLYVHGDSLQDHLIGILVPEPPTLVALAERALGKDNPRVKHIAIDPANPAVLNLSPEMRMRLQELAAEPKVATGIQEMLNAYGKKLQLRGFEYVKRVHISFDPFTVENHMLTPTLKLKRCVCVLWGFLNSN